jgi:2-methylcitrate dehydratase PrpD
MSEGEAAGRIIGNGDHVPPGATQQLVRFVVAARLEDFAAEVRGQGVRAFVNWAGCVLGAFEHEAVTTAERALASYLGPEEATQLGSGRRSNMLQAARLNSMAASARVFDDTYLRSGVHPTTTAAAAALAVGEARLASGADLLTALIVGDEVACRVSNMLVGEPARSHLGLYITSFAGVIGAAVAAARMMGLGERETAWAIGIAVSAASGVRVAHGTHTTPLMAGNAARAGVEAALLAGSGLTSVDNALEGKRGLADVFAAPPNLAAATEGLGARFEILDLAYKPYPCGIVAHGIVDACLQLTRGNDIDLAAIEHVAVEVCPAGVELTGVRHPRDHMNCRNSLHHWAAAALIYGRATIAEEACIDDPKVKALRERIDATPVNGMAPDAARVRVTMADGRVFAKTVEHCVGSRDRPMDDADIDEKFLGQAELAMSESQARSALAACRHVEATHNVAEVVAALVVRERG